MGYVIPPTHPCVCLNWVLVQWRSSSSTPSSLRMSELLNLSRRLSHPAKETKFVRLYPWWHSFGHYPKLMATGWGLGRSTSKLRASLSGSAPSSTWQSGTTPTNYSWRSANLTVDVMLHPSLARGDTIRCFNSFTWVGRVLLSSVWDVCLISCY